MPTRLIAKTELRDRIREHLDDLGDDTLVITDRGRPTTVAVSVSRWNELQQRIEDLEDMLAVESARGSEGPHRSAEALFEELEADVRDPARAQR